MSSPAPSPVTPSKADDCINAIIHDLNAKWNLALPIHTPNASPAKTHRGHEKSIRCVSRIKFIFFKDQESLNRIVREFDTGARALITQLESQWVNKPHQEPGTLPTSSRDIFLKKQNMSESQVSQLRDYLWEILDRESRPIIGRSKAKARQSIAFGRTSSLNGMDEKLILNASNSQPTEGSAFSAITALPFRTKPQAVTDQDHISLAESDIFSNGTTNNSRDEPGHGHSQISGRIADTRPPDRPPTPTEDDDEDYYSSQSAPPSPTESYLSRRDSKNVTPQSRRRISPSKNGNIQYNKEVDMVPLLNNSPSKSPGKRALADLSVNEARRKSFRNSEGPYPRSFQVNVFKPVMTGEEQSSETTNSRSSGRYVPSIADAASSINTLPIVDSTLSSFRTDPGTETEATEELSEDDTYPRIPLIESYQDYQDMVPAEDDSDEEFVSAIGDTMSVLRDGSDMGDLYPTVRSELGENSTQYGSPPKSHDLDIIYENMANGQDAWASELSQPLMKMTLDDSPSDVPVESQTSSQPSSQSKLLDQLVNKCPFGDFPLAGSSLPYRVRYELLRTSATNVVSGEYMNVAQAYNDYDTLWSSISETIKQTSGTPPERTSTRAWEESGKTNGLALYSGDLLFNSEKSGPLLRLQLNPIKCEQSFRLLRKYGNDRFLVVGLPSLDKKDLPEHLQKDPDLSRRGIIDWLIGQEHKFLGRTWRAFYVKRKSDKRSWQRKISKEATRNGLNEIKHLVYLFATGPYLAIDTKLSESLPRITLQELWEWFLPWNQNEKLNIYKAFARMALGVSKTTPTITFQKHEIRRINDIKSDIGKIMNDGCARISKPAAWAISEILGLEQTPSAFQGRIGGAKGLWIVDVRSEHNDGNDFWIEISDSQFKFNPFEDDLDTADDFKLTFESHSCSTSLSRGSLNLQLVTILEDRGVPRDALAYLLEKDLTSEIEDQRTSMDDCVSFRHWNHKNSLPVYERSIDQDLPACGALPDSTSERINLLVESGFEPRSCSFLKDLAWKSVSDHCKRLGRRAHINVGRSTYCFGVPDPLGILEEGEIHLGFSNTFSDPESKFQDTMLHDIDVLITRSPAHLPWDVQKRRAVFHPALRALKDCVVFSVKGDVSLAEICSGGDFDGDKYFVCWDPAIVSPFRNAAYRGDPPEPSEYGIVQDTTRLEDLSSVPDPFGEFLQRTLSFNITSEMLGLCTNFHERFCYEKNSISSNSAIYLGQLLGHLVDASKQGFILSDYAWMSLEKRIKDCHQPLVLRMPAYKDPNADKGKDHIIDYLVFSVARPAIEKMKEMLARYLGAPPTYDDDLVQLYRQFQRDAKANPFLAPILDNLTDDLEALYQDWKEGVNSRMRDQDDPFYVSTSTTADIETDTFAAHVADLHARFHAIKPRPGSQGPVARISTFEWPFLRASLAFSRFHKSKFPWYVAARELSFLKASAVTQRLTNSSTVRGMVPPVYRSMGPKSGYMKRWKAYRAEQHDVIGSGGDRGGYF